VLHDQNLTGTQMVHKINPATDDTLYVSLLQPPSGGQPRGCFATNQYDVYSWVFMSIANSPNGDRVDIWQLEARRDWFQVEMPAEEEDEWQVALSGVINAGVTQDYRLMLDAAELPGDVAFEGYLLFNHNALPLSDTLWLSFDVIGPRRPSAFGLASPADGDTVTRGEEVTFAWQRSSDANAADSVTYAAWFLAGTDSVWVSASDTFVTVVVSDIGFDLTTDTLVTWWVTAMAGGDTVPSNDRWALKYIAPSGVAPDGVPVTFGFEGINPNPFNAQTTIRFGVGRQGPVTLRVYDILGRQSARLLERNLRSEDRRVGKECTG
jgi:hypothetical protein